MTPDETAPRLEAWIEDTPDGPQLNLTVRHDGTEYETLESDLDTLLQLEQYLGAFERPALSLLSAYEQRHADDEPQATEAPVDVESD